MGVKVLKEASGYRFLQDEVVGGCNAPERHVENQTQVFWKSSTSS